MPAHGCCLVKPSSASFGNGAAICLHSRRAFPKILFGSFYKTQMGGRYLKQKSIAKVNITSALSTNTNSSLFIAECRRNSNRPSKRKNKLRPKLLKTLPKPYIETLIKIDDGSKINLENIESTYKDDKNLEVDTFNEQAVTTDMGETFNPLNLQDEKAFMDDFSDENEYIIDDDMRQIIAEKETLEKDSSLKDQLGKLWGSCRDWYTQYKKDISAWGVGNTAIFVVYESGEGEVRVAINEDEIFKRHASNLFGKDENRKTTLMLKIAEAKQLAWDIERGVVKPPRNSSIYHFLDTGKRKGGFSRSAIYQAASNSVIGVGPVPHVLKNLQFGFLVLSGSFFVWALWKYVLRYGIFSEEKDRQKKKQLAIKSFKSSMDENRIGFGKRILEIQNMARQVRIEEQNSSEETDYSNSKTMGTNTDDGRKKEDQPLNSNVLRKKDHDLREPDASDLNVLGGNGKSTMPKEVNMYVQNTLLTQQGSVGNSSINFREYGDRNGKSQKTQQPKVDVLQDGQSSAERAAHNATKETVNVTHTDKGLGKVKKFSQKRFSVSQDGKSSAERATHNARKEKVPNVTHMGKGLGEETKFNQKRFSVKGSHRITPQVITGVKEAREISVSKHGKHSNKSTDASNLNNKNISPVKPVRTKQKSSITKEEISSQWRIEREEYKKLKPVDSKVENVFEDKIGRRKALANGSVKPLGTAEIKAKLNFGNSRAKRLQIEPKNGVPQGNDVLSQEAEELEWTRDEVLRKIVSKVQNNANAGREASDGLVTKEELLFFKGLERKFEREGESVKSWIEERVKNLKYGKVLSGVDGPSMFSTIFLKGSTKEGRSIMSSKTIKDHKMSTTEIGLYKEKPSFISEPIPVSMSPSPTSTVFSNTEIDAKHKSHSGLDMSLAEESIEYASFYAEGKLKNNEIIREPEMVEQKKTASKDNQYKQEMKKILWWLDLPYVLCIGVYRNNEDNVLKGLYSLEMAPVPESSTRPHHTIAFEDHADARNFCYIMQSHFHELGDTSAHVIPLSTKDFYEEAKSTAFKVTVIKKGELQLYVGQPLKEIERRIINIGSAMYN